MSIRGISFRYAELITSLSLFKGTVDINSNNSEKCKNWGLTFRLLTQNWSWAHHYCLVFQTTSERSIIGIRVGYDKLMALRSTFKGTVDMN